MTKISVIMSVYNEDVDWLAESIYSITNQTHKDIEFIIVNDNPNNLENINLIKNISSRDPRIVTWFNNENLGLVRSLNIAISLCTGEYVARMDADDISLPNRLERQLLFLEENKLDLVGANVLLFDDARPEGFFTTDKLQTHKFLKKLLLKGTIGIVHPTFFCRKNLYLQLNGYSDSPHTEDKEFLARVFVNNYKVGNISDVLLKCRYNNSSITKNNAAYVNYVGRYITRKFNDFDKLGTYTFDSLEVRDYQPTESDVKSYNLKQKWLYKMRVSKSKKNYPLFFYYTIRAITSNSTALDNFKVNFYLFIYRTIERINV
ncbi:glycosyltransferase [Vibrio harveyi]|uniref:glycosyltransferase n=1 Tax=Vibrio harveyi TaxID=669 RepID=UPI00039DA3A6|nr:glycosyltransferase [Vibrio harveyi]MBY7701404.1 glycosyltransferase [Vibrio harveyi]PNM53134.1 glycosyltransferase [Vibrio harveyi]UIL57634.1 glycosyltransferase [Vibrio harveyi]SQA27841.1 beta-D-GlcNAc beta-1,3-galactosyltransferase [Vibrio harveyi]